MKIPRHSQRDEYFVTIVDEVIKIFFCPLILRDLTEMNSERRGFDNIKVFMSL